MIIAVDFDGTLARHIGGIEIGAPVPYALPWIRLLREYDATLVLWSCRSGAALIRAAQWCEDQGIGFDHFNDHPRNHAGRGKISANVYVDDHSAMIPLIRPKNNTERAYVDWRKVGPWLRRELLLRKIPLREGR